MPTAIFYPAASIDDGQVSGGSTYGYANNTAVIGDQYGAYNFGICFKNVYIPKGATIESAFVRFKAAASDTDDDVNLNCYFKDLDSGTPPNNPDEEEITVNATWWGSNLSDPVAWNAVENFTSGSSYDTPSLVSILQDIVNRSGFAGGNNISFLIKNNSSTEGAYRTVYQYDYSSGANKPALHVEWTAVDDEYTKLLMHFDGPDAGTTFIDEVEHTLTQYGNAQIDTAQSVFGGASGLFDGNDDYVRAADSDDWDFADGESNAVSFTIDFRIRIHAAPSAMGGVVSTTDGDDMGWGAWIDADRLLYFRMNPPSQSPEPVTGALTLDTWYHIAIVGNVTTGYISIYVDGTRVFHELEYNAWAYACVAGADGLVVGRMYPAYDYNTDFNGWIDELRISKGIARWTGASFTVPTAAYTPPTSTTYEETVEDGFDIADYSAGALSTVYEESIEDTLGLGDQIADFYEDSVADTFGMADTQTYKYTMNHLVADTVFIYDTYAQGWHVKVEDAFNAADSTNKILGFLTDETLYVFDSTATMWKGTANIIDYLYPLDSVQAAYHKQIAESLGVQDDLRLWLILRVSEWLTIQDQVSAFAKWHKAIEESLNINDLVYRGFDFIIDDSLACADTAVSKFLMMSTVDSALGYTDALYLIGYLKEIVQDTIGLGSLALTKSRMLELIKDGILFRVYVSYEEDVYECWVINTQKLLPSIYSGFDFNSYCSYDGRSFGANASGIYELTGRKDDDKEFEAGIEFKETTLGAETTKRIRKVRLGVSGGNPVLVLEVEDGTRKVFSIDEFNRMEGNRDIKGKVWRLSVADFETLDSVKIIPTVLTR